MKILDIIRENIVPIAVGGLLGLMGLVMLQQYITTNQIALNRKMEHERKTELAQTIKDACNHSYPVVHAVIKDDVIIIECRSAE